MDPNEQRVYEHPKPPLEIAALTREDGTATVVRVVYLPAGPRLEIRHRYPDQNLAKRGNLFRPEEIDRLLAGILDAQEILAPEETGR